MEPAYLDVAEPDGAHPRRVLVLNGTPEARRRHLRALAGQLDLRGRQVLLIGMGAQGTLLCYLLCRLARFERLVVVEPRDVAAKVAHIARLTNVRPRHARRAVTRANVAEVCGALREGDLVVDCSTGVDTRAVLRECQRRGALYVNSSIEEWADRPPKPPVEESLVVQHAALEREFAGARATFLVSMGCNPGSVSFWLRIALNMLRGADAWAELSAAGAARAAQCARLRTVHVSEFDSQRSRRARPAGECWNTWSPDGRAFYEEGLDPSEVAYGSHESGALARACVEGGALERFCVLRSCGFGTRARTWAPLHGVFGGYVIRHDECNTIQRFLADGAYAPSVYYVYSPSAAAAASVEEMRAAGSPQRRWRLMAGDIADGVDEVGVALFCAGGRAAWAGSWLDVREARALLDHEMDEFVNATIPQVMGGYLAAIAFCAENPRRGHVLPEEVPLAYAKKWAAALWGPLVFADTRSPFSGERVEDFGLSERV